MISILIPVYNYDVAPLVRELHRQASNLPVPVEIRIVDDHSTNLALEAENRKIGELSDVYYERFNNNKGRAHTRNFLVEQAGFDWLLFLDADMWPGSSDFLKNYTEKMKGNELIFGGIQYENHKPAGKELRWKYGRSREAKPLQKRLKSPYLSILSAVILIKKDCFLAANVFLENRYGLDVLFTANLKKTAPKVVHIHNPAFHLGLEENSVFLEKSRLAMQSIAYFDFINKIPPDHRGIQKLANKLQKSGLLATFLKLYKSFETQILSNLDSENPSLIAFDIYRLHVLIVSQRLYA